MIRKLSINTETRVEFVNITGLVQDVVSSIGFDPIWFGILFVMNCEMGLLTPPFGINLFVMKSVAPKEVTTADIYLSIIPFVALQALVLAIVMIFPQIALWLPSIMI